MSYVKQPVITNGFRAALVAYSSKTDRALRVRGVSMRTAQIVQAYLNAASEKDRVLRMASELHKIIEAGRRDMARINEEKQKPGADLRLLLGQAMFIEESTRVAVEGLEKIEQVIRKE